MLKPKSECVTDSESGAEKLCQVHAKWAAKSSSWNILVIDDMDIIRFI